MAGVQSGGGGLSSWIRKGERKEGRTKKKEMERGERVGDKGE